MLACGTPHGQSFHLALLKMSWEMVTDDRCINIVCEPYPGESGPKWRINQYIVIRIEANMSLLSRIDWLWHRKSRKAVWNVKFFATPLGEAFASHVSHLNMYFVHRSRVFIFIADTSYRFSKRIWPYLVSLLLWVEAQRLFFLKMDLILLMSRLKN